MNTAEKIGCGCGVAVLAMAVLCLLPIVLVLFMLCGSVATALEGSLNGDAVAYGVDAPACERPLGKKWICGDGDESDPQVVCITLRGVIEETVREGLFADELSAYSRALREIRAATRDEDVRGIVLKLDTPGGTVTDSDVMADALRRFKAAGEGRFVLVLMGSMCCSGGYYVAAEADWIMANPTTLTGSIGVIMASYNAAELAKKVGLKSVVIASGENKALLDPMEPVNPAHVAILKRPVEHDYARFVSIVARGRKLPVDEVKKIADGRVLSAQDAKVLKLVDELGYAEDAWRKAAELAQAEKIRVYRYEEPFSWKSIFSESFFMKCGRAFAGGVKAEVEGSAPRNEYRLR
jgi:protease IV